MQKKRLVKCVVFRWTVGGSCLKIPKEKPKAVKRRRTDNSISKSTKRVNSGDKWRNQVPFLYSLDPLGICHNFIPISPRKMENKKYLFTYHLDLQRGIWYLWWLFGIWKHAICFSLTFWYGFLGANMSAMTNIPRRFLSLLVVLCKTILMTLESFNSYLHTYMNICIGNKHICNREVTCTITLTPAVFLRYWHVSVRYAVECSV